MTDTPMNRTLRGTVAVCMLMLCWLLIGWIVLAGDPENSLHASALAWAFAMQLGIMAGLGFGAALERWPGAKN